MAIVPWRVEVVYLDGGLGQPVMRTGIRRTKAPIQQVLFRALIVSFSSLARLSGVSSIVDDHSADLTQSTLRHSLRRVMYIL